MSAMTWTGCPPRTARPARPAPPVRVARPPARPERVAAPARVTRRGRLVVLALLFGLILGVVVLAMAPATATNDRGDHLVAERVTVQPGDTLWAIAERARPDADPRATIARIKDMNGLTSGAARAGQVLLVPAASAGEPNP
jgi:nucleoid-associated protein YgaU